MPAPVTLPAPVLVSVQRGTWCRDQSAGYIAFTVVHPAGFSTAWPTPTLSEMVGQVWGVPEVTNNYVYTSFRFYVP